MNDPLFQSLISQFPILLEVETPGTSDATDIAKLGLLVAYNESSEEKITLPQLSRKVRKYRKHMKNRNPPPPSLDRTEAQGPSTLTTPCLKLKDWVLVPSRGFSSLSPREKEAAHANFRTLAHLHTIHPPSTISICHHPPVQDPPTSPTAWIDINLPSPSLVDYIPPAPELFPDLSD